MLKFVVYIVILDLNRMGLAPMNEVEMRETLGGSLFSKIVGAVVYAAGVIVGIIAGTDSKVSQVLEGAGTIAMSL